MVNSALVQFSLTKSRSKNEFLNIRRGYLVNQMVLPVLIVKMLES